MKDKSELNLDGRIAFYAVLFDRFKVAAADLGYALTIHGSMASDMDLIAIPWTEEASEPEELVKAISDEMGPTIWKDHHIKEKVGTKKPSDFAKVDPMSSVLRKAEPEIIALNIMKILARTGDTWRTLTCNEYEKERKKDGNYSDREKEFWPSVIGYTESEAQARMFSKFWKEI